MNDKIAALAAEAFKRLSRKPNTFINVCVDDWRGWRFIFDTEEVRNCDNNCDNCKLFNLLKNDEKEGKDFSSGLYPADQEDKELFGKQNFLNCKTLEQYRDCYVNYLLKKANTEREIREELNLIKHSFRIIFSKETDNLTELEDKFRKSILQRVLRQADEHKRNKIIRICKELP